MEDLRKRVKEGETDAILMRKETLDLGIRSFKQNAETQMVLGSVKNDTHAIKNKIGLYFGSMVSLAFILGLLIGTQYETWSPFVNDIYNTYKTVRGATK